jgi:hypothetical protein
MDFGSSTVYGDLKITGDLIARSYDANTLDGLEASAFLQKTGGTLSGRVSFPSDSGNNKSSNYIGAGGGFGPGSGLAGLKIGVYVQSDNKSGLGQDVGVAFSNLML